MRDMPTWADWRAVRACRYTSRQRGVGPGDQVVGGWNGAIVVTGLPKWESTRILSGGHYLFDFRRPRNA